MARKKASEFDPEAAATMTSAEIAEYLSEREQKFAQEFNESLNGTQSAIRAGYSAGAKNASAAVQACRLLRDPRVRAYRTALIRESAEDLSISRESLLLRLIDVYDRCTQAVPVMTYDSSQKKYVESGEWEFDSRGALRALEQISKLFGLEAPLKLSGADGEPVRVVLSEEALENGG